ncbi:hypothetical protein EDB81DRAFT_784638 [Dactylonectria macrodidyma]|uniref:Uncharacterized protein n=1 Tax=Dactylonectria macrodidyma TaxID=307937 RepID=A0A9P9JCE9_9HYPO|nr:hypothetical protein EDB81DRAFT_784638 [Dactylonectria macrodidyma]
MGARRQRNPFSNPIDNHPQSPLRFEIGESNEMDLPLHPYGPVPQTRGAAQSLLGGSDDSSMDSVPLERAESLQVRRSGNRGLGSSRRLPLRAPERLLAADSGSHQSRLNNNYSIVGGSTNGSSSHLPDSVLELSSRPPFQSPFPGQSHLAVPSTDSFPNRSGPSNGTVVRQQPPESAMLDKLDAPLNGPSPQERPYPTLRVSSSHSQQYSRHALRPSAQIFAVPSMPWIFDGKVIRINIKFRGGREYPCLAKCCLGRQHSLADIRIVEDMPLKPHPVPPQRRRNQTTEKVPRFFCFFHVAEVENIGRVNRQLVIQFGRLSDPRVSIELGFEALAQLGCIPATGFSRDTHMHVAAPGSAPTCMETSVETKATTSLHPWSVSSDIASSSTPASAPASALAGSSNMGSSDDCKLEPMTPHSVSGTSSSGVGFGAPASTSRPYPSSSTWMEQFPHDG